MSISFENVPKAMKLAKICSDKIENATARVNKVLNDNKLEDLKEVK